MRDHEANSTTQEQPLFDPRWNKSSYSGDGGGNCVEVLNSRESVQVRDSKDQTGPSITVSQHAWTSLLHSLRLRY